MKKAHFWMVLGMIVSTLMTSCTKDMDDEISLLGSWIETSPVEGRTELFFGSGNRLIRKAGGATEEYRYKIVDNRLILTLPEDEESRSELIFNQINENTLKIESFYPKIPESPSTFIIFERIQE